MKILVVEDIEMHRKLITKILSKIKNIEIITAEDAFEGYAILKAIDDIELLILDHPMIYVCKKDCRGLCPHCGVNLNDTKCRCADKTKPQSFSTFRMIRSQKEDKKNG